MFPGLANLFTSNSAFLVKNSDIFIQWADSNWLLDGVINLQHDAGYQAAPAWVISCTGTSRTAY